MEYKFRDEACTMCGADLETAEPAGYVHKNPVTKELVGYCSECMAPQPVVEGEPKAARESKPEPD